MHSLRKFAFLKAAFTHWHSGPAWFWQHSRALLDHGQVDVISEVPARKDLLRYQFVQPSYEDLPSAVKIEAGFHAAAALMTCL